MDACGRKELPAPGSPCRPVGWVAFRGAAVACGCGFSASGRDSLPCAGVQLPFFQAGQSYPFFPKGENATSQITIFAYFRLCLGPKWEKRSAWPFPRFLSCAIFAVMRRKEGFLPCLCWCAAGVVCAVAAAVVLKATDPLSVAWLPRCPVKWATGLDCPGCGLLRAAHAALCGRWAEAWSFNAFLVVSLPYAFWLVLARIARALGREPRWLRAAERREVVWAYLAACAVWGVWRNLT